jgi:hypothetical protein
VPNNHEQVAHGKHMQETSDAHVSLQLFLPYDNIFMLFKGMDASEIQAKSVQK